MLYYKVGKCPMSTMLTHLKGIKMGILARVSDLKDRALVRYGRSLVAIVVAVDAANKVEEGAGNRYRAARAAYKRWVNLPDWTSHIGRKRR